MSASSDWQAYVDAMPGPDRKSPTLHVSGSVTLPDDSWSARLTRTAVFETDPVQVQIDILAEPNHPGAGPATRTLSGAWSSEARVGSVTIMCRGRMLTRIAPVVSAL